jgi:hypothetical protein
MANKMGKERRDALLAGHKRMRKLCSRLQERLGTLSSCDLELDDLSEMANLLSLRMQRLMETRSKMFETIGNVLKRMADTQEEIIHALK